MTSTCLEFTYAYQQPSEYRFSLDSIYFAKFVAERLKNRPDLAEIHILDLCAGCGVIGLQLSWFMRELKHIDFMEVQDTYTPYFQQNSHIVNRPELKLEWLLLNYEHLLDDSWHNKYDIIISNPPYFQINHGMLSPSKFKNRCRFFIDSTFENFILGMANALRINGQAYFLQRPLEEHGCDLFSEAEQLLKNMSITLHKVGKLRSTDVVCMTKYAGPEKP